ncbi:hypothetical protein [Corynebacterium glucuronolyticum]|uniref:Uncharacterized protein n=2 Tax=Corynebacterium glucuronolyticum TaxID=39791 RepID=A0AAX1L6N7_9CORY|nr:hypothetical protein [Corynebacterium glucuronolyticum]EEI62387.1 hypothetical protein HMPREF0293_2108 [Corynebacterium glucuronolyticum ATCC 51866]MCT1442158.1 hypothetical protein [Corynebacterium glucuronolyticum]QRP70128.1 hypothetical protein I6J21_10135 [Corynebacterium glucuronolyticum]
MRRLLSVATILLAGLGLASCNSSPEPAPYLTESTAATATTEASESVSETTTTVTATAEPSMKERCAPGVGVKVAPGEEAVNYCDGEWKYSGTYGSDHLWASHWENGQWKAIDKDGQYPESLLPCYSESLLSGLGAPGGLIDEAFTCPPPKPTPTTTSPAPDRAGMSCAGGRYILIVESVLVYPGQDAGSEVQAGLSRHPGAQATSPGACPSLRAHYDGADVYPIFINYGSDRAGVCAAQARGEGNARELKMSVDNYASPC